jgi:hypothetical protein
LGRGRYSWAKPLKLRPIETDEATKSCDPKKAVGRLEHAGDAVVGEAVIELPGPGEPAGGFRRPKAMDCRQKAQSEKTVTQTGQQKGHGPIFAFFGG